MRSNYLLILSDIQNNYGHTVTDCSKILGISMNCCCTNIKKAIRNGHIEIQTKKGDKRKKFCYITKKGVEYIEIVKEIR